MTICNEVLANYLPCMDDSSDMVILIYRLIQSRHAIYTALQEVWLVTLVWLTSARQQLNCR